MERTQFVPPDPASNKPLDDFFKANPDLAACCQQEPEEPVDDSGVLELHGFGDKIFEVHAARQDYLGITTDDGWFTHVRSKDVLRKLTCGDRCGSPIEHR
jgi:hypothetical protein